jgi:hypothetical protein
MRLTPMLLAGAGALALLATTLPAQANPRDTGPRGDGGPPWHHPAPPDHDWNHDGGRRWSDRGSPDRGWDGQDHARRDWRPADQAYNGYGHRYEYAPPPAYFAPPGPTVSFGFSVR